MNGQDFIRGVRRLTAPLERRCRLMIARAIVELVDDTKTCQTLQLTIRADQLRSDVERFQQYGMSSVPQAEAEALVVMVSGSTDHPIVLAVEDRRYRPTSLAEGEVCVYTLQNGIRVHCKADGTVLLGTTPTAFVALAPNTESRLAALESFAWGHTHLVSTTGTATAQSGTAAAQAGVTTLNNPAAPVTAAEVKAK